VDNLQLNQEQHEVIDCSRKATCEVGHGHLHFGVLLVEKVGGGQAENDVVEPLAPFEMTEEN